MLLHRLHDEEIRVLLIALDLVPSLVYGTACKNRLSSSKLARPCHASTNSCLYCRHVYESHTLIPLLGAKVPASQQFPPSAPFFPLQLAASCWSLVAVYLHPSLPFPSFALPNPTSSSPPVLSTIFQTAALRVCSVDGEKAGLEGREAAARDSRG